MGELAVACTNFKYLDAIRNGQTLLDRIDDCVADGFPFAINQFRFGNEFCERLLPTLSQLETAVALTKQAGLSFALVTPNLTDRGLKKLGKLLPHVPEDGEIIVNDWGAAAMVAEEYPRHSLVAGRLLCKHLKEARISTPAVDPEVDWPVNNTPFRALLELFGIERVEVDLAPHTSMPTNKAQGVKLTLHLNIGYSAKSHVCKVGSLHQAAARKFTPGHACQRECLSYVTHVNRLPYPAHDANRMFQRGNTWFYHYTERMQTSIAEALRADIVDRAVLMLDWHEDRLPH